MTVRDLPDFESIGRQRLTVAVVSENISLRE